MATKLNEITAKYHTFVDNQVLTKDQLNEFINYFEDQDRMSRVFLHGVGVVCGFQLSYNSTDSSITITQGSGITTDGDLIKLNSNIPESSFKSIDLSQVKYTHFKKFEDGKSKYNFFAKKFIEDEEEKSIPLDLWEILPAQTEDEPELSTFTSLQNMVVLLYLESYAKDADLCTSIDCDNQGIEQVSKLRVLLISKTDAEYIASLDPVFTWHDIFEKYTELPEIKAARVDLTNVNTIQLIKQRFSDAISQQVLDKLKEGYQSISEIFGHPLISDKIDQLFNFKNPEITTPIDFQYRYDLLTDLIDTYNEIKEILLHINSECNPNIGSFPKHLLLGKLSETEIYKTFRHRFYKSPISKTEDFNRKKVLSLVNRAEQLAQNYNVTEETDIRITPSHLSAELGCKAIPYYYKVDDTFLDFWSFEKFVNLKQKYNLSYHVSALAEDQEVRKPFLFINDDYNFYRIEGHLGLSALESCDNINSYRTQHGLNFDCMVLELESNIQSFVNFVKKHPPILHKAGVPKGGTFILIAMNDETVADFSLPYKIPVEVEEQSCCSLMECTYPWISSLKYMNNLSRSLKGTQSRNKAMPQDYRLQVIEYKINGQSLLTRTTTLSIPLQQIFLRRMHAVTEALNIRFGKGVVFDFNESQKRFVITRAKEDTFTIRMRDVTQANNNPVYTYSNNGMFRNNLVFRPDAMRCRDLKKYNPLFYENLQKKIAPLNKDDDYGVFDEKWKRWNELKTSLVSHPFFVERKLARMITRANQLPPEIQTELRTLKTDFQQVAENDLQFMLDGDWVTGEWVNIAMLDYHRTNKKNTHDSIVLFVNLRKFLHSETGITKLSIYITNQEYNRDFDDVIEKYNRFADIYFGTPTGINTIQI